MTNSIFAIIGIVFGFAANIFQINKLIKLKRSDEFSIPFMLCIDISNIAHEIFIINLYIENNNLLIPLIGNSIITVCSLILTTLVVIFRDK